MKHFSELSGVELNDAIAIAAGADANRSVAENTEATGLPFKFMAHWEKPVFALVNAAGVVDRWDPSTLWNQGARLLTSLLSSGHILMQPPGEPVTILKGDRRVVGTTILEAIGRAFVAHCGD